MSDTNSKTFSEKREETKLFSPVSRRVTNQKKKLYDESVENNAEICWQDAETTGQLIDYEIIDVVSYEENRYFERKSEMRKAKGQNSNVREQYGS